jgi:hypothetical protein
MVMKKGKQLGEYNLKVTSVRVKDAGEIEINVEGNIEGIGQDFRDRYCRSGATRTAIMSAMV